jgi:hypothetical protein
VIHQAGGAIEFPVTVVTGQHVCMTEIEVTIIGVYCFARLARFDASVLNLVVITLVAFRAIVFGAKEARGRCDGMK